MYSQISCSSQKDSGRQTGLFRLNPLHPFCKYFCCLILESCAIVPIIGCKDVSFSYFFAGLFFIISQHLESILNGALIKNFHFSLILPLPFLSPYSLLFFNLIEFVVLISDTLHAISLLTTGYPYFSITSRKDIFGLTKSTLSMVLTNSLISGYSSPVSKNTAFT